MNRLQITRRALAVVAVASIQGLGAEAVPISVRIHPGAEGLPCTSGHLAASLQGSSDGAGRIEGIPVEIPSSPEIDLTPGSWRLNLQAEGCWSSSPVAVVVPEGNAGVSLSVWPLVPVKGRLGPARGDPAFEEVELEFAPSFKDPGSVGPEGRTTCPVGSNSAFLCRLPAAKLDLRIAVRGFAPHYAWNTDLSGLDRSESKDLGRIQLVEGASLSGWLVSEASTSPSPEDVQVTVAPLGLGGPTTPGEDRLTRAMTSAARVQDNGFFQFQDLDPGEYLLRVTSERYAEATVEVLVVENSASEPRHPILLRPPMKAEFVIDPPLDYSQRNWRLELSRVDRYRSHAAEVAEGEVSATGWWEHAPVNPTLHFVKVSDSHGQQVLGKRIDLAVTPMPVVLEIGIVPIEGRATLGDEPLQATIWFGGKHGAEQVEVTSSEDGLFQGVLPRSGFWRVQLEAEEPRVKRVLVDVEVPEWSGSEPAEVNLRVENTKISGRVLEEDGSPPKRPTIVYVVRGTWDRHVSERIEPAGDFEILGLEEGIHQVYAMSADSRSETLAVDLQEDEDRRVTLTLQKQQKVTGRVITDSGEPIPGAFVVVQPSDQPFVPTRRYTTDGEGRFEADVAASVRSVNVTAGAPGRTLGVFRSSLGRPPDLLIELPAEGGALEVRLDEGDVQKFRDRTLVVFRDGVPFAPGDIQGWATIHKDPVGEATTNELRVEALVPGSYEACLVPVAEYPRWLLGYRERGSCRSGHIGYLGELEVNLSQEGG